MDSVKSKFSIVQAFLIPLFMLLLIFGIAGLLYLVARLEMADGVPLSKTVIWGTFVFGPMGLYTIYYYLDKLFSIKIDQNGVQLKGLFKSEFIPWEIVDNIKVTCKSAESFLLISRSYEAAWLLLQQGKGQVFFAKYYSNFNEIQLALESALQGLKKRETINLAAVRNPAIHPVKLENYAGLQRFSGNHVFSLNGISLYGLIALFIYYFFSIDNLSIAAIGVLLFLIGLLYWIFGRQLHYFYMSKEYLVVKNQIWPWVNDQYRIADLRELVFEMPYRRSKSLRIINKNYKTKLYMAGSLRSKTWKELNQLTKHTKLKVRNEI